MSLTDTPFLTETEAGELFRLMSEKSKPQRRKLAARELAPRDLLDVLKGKKPKPVKGRT